MVKFFGRTVDRTIKMFIYSVNGTFIIATKFLTYLASVVL